MRYKLRPLRDLQPLHGTESARLTPTGQRPTLGVGDAPARIASGWHIVSIDIEIVDELALEAGAPSPVTLRFLPATGTVPLARRSIPQLRGKHARVVHIPEGTDAVEVELSPWVQEVEARSISFRAIKAAAAAAAMSGDIAASSVAGSTDRSSLVDRLQGARRTGGARAALSEIAATYESLQQRRSGDSVDYPSWQQRHSTLDDDDRDRLQAMLAALPGGGPSITIAMPVHDPEPELLREAIDSIQSQIYTRWRLVAVNDASSNPEVAAVLDEAAANDSRILVRHRKTNGHISVATNNAIDLATGEFVAFMDHDDLLAPFALALIGLAGPTADIIYTDEDKVDRSGRHYDPHFKPPWNPELLLGQNYLSHLTAVRRSLLTKVGGLRVGFEGAQDHDLMLRLTALVEPERIAHVPFVLYHWRAIEGSTALNPSEKSYTQEASIRALEDHLGPDWSVEQASAPTAYRSTPPLEDFPLVSILIPTRDRLDLVQQCVESLASTTYPAFEILIIDNDSSEPATLEWFASFDNGRDRRVIPAPGEFNFSRINNLGAQHARGDLLLLLNNDTEVINPEWLSIMVRWIRQPGIGITGAKLLYPNNTIQHAGVILGQQGLAGHGHLHSPGDSPGYFNRLALTHEVGAVTGACLLTWRTDWVELGGLDEELAVAFNDLDYCMRVRHQIGRRILWCADATLYHHESISRGAEDDPVKVARFNAEVDLALSRWSSMLGDDPAYSPNLSLAGDSFSLAREPRVTAPWTAPPLG